MKRRDDGVQDPVGVELLGNPSPYMLTIHRLGLFGGIHKDCQSPHVFARFRTLTPGRKPVHEYSRFTGAYECGSSPYAYGRTTSEKDLLEGQGPVVIVGQISTRP